MNVCHLTVLDVTNIAIGREFRACVVAQTLVST